MQIEGEEEEGKENSQNAQRADCVESSWVDGLQFHDDDIFVTGNAPACGKGK